MGRYEKRRGGGVLTREQFLFNEARTVARLRLEGLDDGEVVRRVVEDNLFQYPTERMIKNLATVCLFRLDSVRLEDAPEPDPFGVARLIAEGHPDVARMANLYLMMRCYDLAEAFMVELVGRKYTELDYSLSRMDTNAFFTEYCSSNGDAARWADSTVVKLKQVMRKCLVETGQLASATSEELVPVFLDLELEDAMRALGDAHMLPAFNSLEVM